MNCHTVYRNTRIVTLIGRFRDIIFHNIVCELGSTLMTKFNADLYAYSEPNKGKKTCNCEIATEIGYITVLYCATRTVKRSSTEL